MLSLCNRPLGSVRALVGLPSGRTVAYHHAPVGEQSLCEDLQSMDLLDEFANGGR